MSETILFIVGAAITGLVALYMILTINLFKREQANRAKR